MKSDGLLLVEDSESTAMLYETWLGPLGERINIAHTGSRALAWLQQHTPSVILLDMHLPDMEGMDILRLVRQRGLSCEVIVITADTSHLLASRAVHEGAQDFLVKPVDAERLRVSVSNALRTHRLEHLASDLAAQMAAAPPGGFCGSSIQMRALYHTLRLVAHSDAPVFISGESGTGKELCARAIHDHGRRSKQAFVAVNCAAMPAELVESQLFGHVKGAFTGAVAHRVGLTEEADGGTLFLDEVTELTLEAQSKLLRFLQTGEITPVGASGRKHLNCRVVCATNLDIRHQVEKGLFREDLFYRLHVVPLTVPPLRERGEDVLEIGNELLQRYSVRENKRFRALGDSARQLLLSYHWPGNIRELENIIRHAVVMHDDELLEAAHISLPESNGSNTEGTAGRPHPEILPLWRVEQEAIERALSFCQGNVSRAAELLEVAPSTLYRRLRTRPP